MSDPTKDRGHLWPSIVAQEQKSKRYGLYCLAWAEGAAAEEEGDAEAEGQALDVLRMDGWSR